MCLPVMTSRNAMTSSESVHPLFRGECPRVMTQSVVKQTMHTNVNTDVA